MYYGHSGIDFVTKSGTYVYAVGDGVVESIVLDYTGAVVVLIDHGNGFKSEYTYIDPSDYIFEGATVKEGDRIGFVTEPYGMERFDDYHLHFELFKDGESIDPSEYLNIT
jgi:murein DD-endopeptidase MepM/ murein hydrolase activator NlpD